jgi:hypothetical protein
MTNQSVGSKTPLIPDHNTRSNFRFQPTLSVLSSHRPLNHCLRQHHSSPAAVMASTKQAIKNASPTLFEMEDRWLSMSQQKPVPTKRDAGPVGINSGKESEQENQPLRNYLTGWKLWILAIGHVSWARSESSKAKAHCIVFGSPSFSPPLSPPLSVPRWFQSPTP